jgi:hypothetical protein
MTTKQPDWAKLLAGPLVETWTKNGEATRCIDRGSDVPLYASLAQMKEIQAKWNLIAQKCINDANLWPCVEAIADILFRQMPVQSKFGEITPAGASMVTCADELLAHLRERGICELLEAADAMRNDVLDVLSYAKKWDAAKAKLLAGSPNVGGTVGLDGDTRRDWETDGPAWEKRAREAEAKLLAKGASE